MVGHLYSLFLIGVGFLIFSHSDLGAAFATFLALFGVGIDSFATSVALYTLVRMVPLILVSAIGATPIPKRIWERIQIRHPRLQSATVILCLALFAVCVAYLVDSTFSPFEYTQF